MKKDYSLSMIRLISLIMIISCHVLQGLNISAAFWVNLGVQIFFFLSGFLYGNKKIENVKDYYKSRLKRILVPYIIFCLIIIIFEIAIFKTNYYYLKIVGSLLGFQATYGCLNTTSHLWFITYILICYLLIPVFQRIFDNDYKENKKNLITISIFLTLIYFFKIINLNAAWIINFILGYYFAKLPSTKHNKFLAIMIIFSLLTLPLKIIYFYDILTNTAIYRVFLPYRGLLVDFNHVFIGVTLFIIFYKMLRRIKIKRSLFLDLSDKYSYHIYLTHQVFILNCFSILFLTEFRIVNIYLIFSCSIISGIILYYICLLVSKILKIVFSKD